jgi:uncharacterized protein (DUF58 family)
LELTPIGRLFLWLNVSLGAAAIFLPNAFIFLAAALLLLFLLFDGTLFHRATKLVTDSIKLQNSPRTVETQVGKAFKLETVLTNCSISKLRIVRLIHNLPTGIEEVRSPTIREESQGKKRIVTLLRACTSGSRAITKSTVVLEGRMHFFSHRAEFSNKVAITALPIVDRIVDPIETNLLSDLAVDHSRRGAGTDLAGIRPFRMLDDFHCIDWKATARTGKLMTRESYLEKEPTVVLMIDVSRSMRFGNGKPSPLEGLLSDLGNLLAAIRPTSPLALILYDEQKIIANTEPKQGAYTNEEVLRTLLEKVKSTSVPRMSSRRRMRSYTELTKETRDLVHESTVSTKPEAHRGLGTDLASFILPFYEKATAKRFGNLKRQGAFQAFQATCALSEPALVIVISDGQTNLDGLAEGAKNARNRMHQIVLAIVSPHDTTERTEAFSVLRNEGVRILECLPTRLSAAVNSEILKLSQERRIQSRILQ